MPSRKFVLAYSSGGAMTLWTMVETECHDTPPSVELSRRMLVRVDLSAKLVSGVKMVPFPSTCGSRYVSPCGLLPALARRTGVDHAVCVPSDFASANEAKGTGVRESNTTHNAQTRSNCRLVRVVAIVSHCLPGSRPFDGFVAMMSFAT